MASQFCCNYCGDVLKKNKLKTHVEFSCNESDNFSCVECNKEFTLELALKHLRCQSKAEKYLEKLSRDKITRGDFKQYSWLAHIQNVSTSSSSSSQNEAFTDPEVRAYLKVLAKMKDIPRKKTKFDNFCKSCVKIHDSEIRQKLWTVLIANFEEKPSLNLDVATDKNDFDWKQCILDCLTSTVNNRLKIEKLEADVLVKYGQFCNVDIHSENFDDQPLCDSFRKSLRNLSSKVKIGDKFVHLRTDK